MAGESRSGARARPGLGEMLAWALAYVAADLLVRHLGDAEGDGGNLPSPVCGLLPKPFTGAELSRAVQLRMVPQPVQGAAGVQLT